MCDEKIFNSFFFSRSDLILIHLHLPSSQSTICMKIGCYSNTSLYIISCLGCMNFFFSSFHNNNDKKNNMKENFEMFSWSIEKKEKKKEKKNI